MFFYRVINVIKSISITHNQLCNKQGISLHIIIILNKYTFDFNKVKFNIQIKDLKYVKFIDIYKNYNYNLYQLYNYLIYRK